jgi:membrane associated rhomboid family serine protease
MAELRTIKRVPVGTLALIVAVINAVISFIYGVFSAIFILGSAASLNAILPEGVSIGSGATLGITVIITATIGGFIGGYIVTAIVALLYNWLAPRIGGIKLEFE